MFDWEFFYRELSKIGMTWDEIHSQTMLSACFILGAELPV